MKVSLFEISYKKKLFHDIIIYWDAPVYINTNTCVYLRKMCYVYILNIFIYT